MTGSTQADEGGVEVENGRFEATPSLDLDGEGDTEDEMYGAIEDVVDDLIAATEDARESEVFREFLDAQSRFHSYSFRNTLLIKMQRPDATRVAGYRTWQDEFDRQVQKGETGIRILRPIITTRCPVCENAPSYHDKIGCEYDDTAPDEWDSGLVGFTTATVFDIGQTEGEPVPMLPTDAEADDTEAPLDAFLDAAASLGVTAEVVAPDEWNRRGSGSCDLTDGSVEALGGRSDAAVVGTLAHEYGHAELHAEGGEAENEADREAREVETEAVAYVVGRYFGLDMSGSAFYLAAWSDDDGEKIRKRLDRIAAVSGRIIDAVRDEIDD